MSLVGFEFRVILQMAPGNEEDGTRTRVEVHIQMLDCLWISHLQIEVTSNLGFGLKIVNGTFVIGIQAKSLTTEL